MSKLGKRMIESARKTRLRLEAEIEQRTGLTDIIERQRRRATNAEDTVTGQYYEIERLREALVMTENRLEAALLGPDVCRHCVELARSYALDALGGKVKDGSG